MKITFAAAASSLLLAAPAIAQGAPAAPPPMQSDAAPAQTAISDDEVSRFALAALVIQQIAGDETLDQGQQQSAMISTVQQVGLQPQRYNEIAQQSQGDEGLQERIELAAAGHIEEAQRNQQNQ